MFCMLGGILHRWLSYSVAGRGVVNFKWVIQDKKRKNFLPTGRWGETTPNLCANSLYLNCETKTSLITPPPWRRNTKIIRPEYYVFWGGGGYGEVT